MKYQVNVPAVDGVSPDESFTRRLRVLVKADPALDIRLDENKYSYEFNVFKGQEFRVEAANEGEKTPFVFTTTIDDADFGEIFAGAYFSVVAQSDVEPDPNEDREDVEVEVSDDWTEESDDPEV